MGARMAGAVQGLEAGRGDDTARTASLPPGKDRRLVEVGHLEDEAVPDVAASRQVSASSTRADRGSSVHAAQQVGKVDRTHSEINCRRPRPTVFLRLRHPETRLSTAVALLGNAVGRTRRRHVKVKTIEEVRRPRTARLDRASWSHTRLEVTAYDETVKICVRVDVTSLDVHVVRRRRSAVTARTGRADHLPSCCRLRRRRVLPIAV